MSDLIHMADFEVIQLIGRSLIASSFFQIQGKPDDPSAIAQAVVKVMAGRELGIPPVAAMMGVNVIQGRVSLSAQLMLACAKRAGYEYDVRENIDWCSVEWSRGGKMLGKSAFSFADAEKAGLVKPGGNWVKYRSDMLFWRAVARGVRRFCPDATSGMAVYSPDEIDDKIEIDPESSGESPVRGSRELQAAAMKPQLIAAGMTPEQAEAAAAKLIAPRGKKAAKPEPLTITITDDDLPPELRGQHDEEPSDVELDAAMEKQESASGRLKW